MIPGDECGLNFLTFALQLRKNPGITRKNLNKEIDLAGNRTRSHNDATPTLQRWCYLETLEHFGYIASRIFGCLSGGYEFLLCNRCVFVKFTDLILWFMNLRNTGRTNCGRRFNHYTKQHLHWLLRNITQKRTPVRLVDTWIWTLDPRIRDQCVTIAPPHSIWFISNWVK